MTSVKEFRIRTEPTEDGLGRGSFRFTDDYSVFDWGKMPDAIPEKGASLCAMGAFNFERLDAAGVPTHYQGVLPEGSAAPVALGDVDAPPREMAIDVARVPDLPHDGRSYDYGAYHDAADDYFLVPLEIVFRNVVPIGSSLRSRTDPGDHGLEYDEWPEEAVRLAEPIVEFSTKFERGDRYLDRAEADRIAGAADLVALERTAREVNDLVTEQAARAGFDHQDGKIECLYADGEIRVADVVGTFDENRFSYDGTQVSKEVVRQHYKATQPAWIEAVEAAKARAKAEDVADWKPLCDAEPAPLPADVVAAVRDLYAAGANAYVDREFFEAPDLDAAVSRVRDLA